MERGAPTEIGGDPEAHEPTARLFAAAWPPSEVVAVLSSLDRPVLDAVRWTTPDQWHVTFAFLGNVARSRIDDVGAALVGATSLLTGPPEAVLGPTTERVGRSILCVPVRGLDDLAVAVRRGLRSVAPDADLDRPFDGHLTLARARGRRAMPASRAGAPLVARWHVRDVGLIRSELSPSGARYTTLLSAAVPS